MKNDEYTSPLETFDPRREGRAIAIEVIRRLTVWIVDAPTSGSRGLRATVVLYCIRPDLIGGATLEEIGHSAGCTRQLVHKLATDFRLNRPWRPSTK
jgi:hypothetical protein